MSFIFTVLFIVGLCMYLIPTTHAKVTRIGEMLLFAGILGIMLTLAPAFVAKLR